MEIDHAFVCTEKAAPAGDLLVRCGLSEGSGNRHPGQGTANRRFFFHNFMLELLWLENGEEAGCERARPLRLDERFRHMQARACSPYGLGFRPAPGDGAGEPAFDWSEYKPAYLPEGLAIQVARNTPLREPLYFHLPFARRRNREAAAHDNEPLEHAIGWRELTFLSVTVASPPPLSAAAGKINESSNCGIKLGARPLMELEFDHGRQNRHIDFRPALPLVCFW